jgi:predicted nuclease of restriction endonuclease-like (RecB) superfamily
MLSTPEIRETVAPEFQKFLLNSTAPIRETPSPEFGIPARQLLGTLSFSHFAELLGVEDDHERRFCEIECVTGAWSVRELRRQMASLYYQRSGLSQDKHRLSELANSAAESDCAAAVVRDPYVFEFLGLKPKEVLPESELEDALLDKIQDFLLELGKGFCFEARQRRILIGGEYFFVDLVFYHRVLKCHVLIELKADEFRHEHLGQLNTYVSWYQAHEMCEGDNPAIGILLCTRKNHALVQYALASMTNQLFVSKYQLALPSPEQLQQFVEAQLAGAGGALS